MKKVIGNYVTKDIEYLYDLPRIPDDLIPSSEEIINLENYFLSNVSGRRPEKMANNLTGKKIPGQLKQWLIDNLNFKFWAGLYVMSNVAMPHVDLRRSSLNYVIDTGGENIVTTTYDGYVRLEDNIANKWSSIPLKDNLEYDDKLSISQQMIIEPRRWVFLNTSKFHSVTGEFTRPRILINIAPEWAIPDIESTYPTIYNTLLQSMNPNNW